MAVSQTLQIPRDDIELFDSFTDLGGDQDAAEALHQACRRKGIDARIDDIMHCHTLAELQTRITPYPPPPSLALGFPLPPSSTMRPATMLLEPPSTRTSEDESVPSSTSMSADDVFSPTNRHSRCSVSSYGSMSTTSSYKDTPMARRTGQDLESLLKSSPRVNNVALVTPRAGPFDGQLVALVAISADSSIATSSSSQPQEIICLPPPSQHTTHKREIRSLRMAVQEWGADSRRPQIWVPLRRMAELDDGRPDTRRLQTWVQNINDGVYRDIMKLQMPEPRRTVSRQKEIQSWAESRRSFWRDDDEMDCDDMECFPLAPMQKLYFETWMDHMDEATAVNIGEPGFRCTQSVMLKILGGADDADIEAAVEAMVARHAMLRARFRPVRDYWVQVIIPQASNSYRFRHHRDVDDEEMVALIDAAQTAINPADGPVFAVEHIRNDKEQLLYLTAHHLVVDSISWRIMVHDLDELLREGTLLSEGSIPFPHWVDYQSYEMSQRLFEPTLPFEVLPADVAYWHLTKDSNRYGDALRSAFSFSAELSQILQRACVDVLRTDTADVFLAALLLSFRQTFADRSPPTLWKREHGRDVVHADFNIMETVGWFTSLCPVGVPIEPTTDLIQVIKLMKDTRRAIPRDGVPFFTSEFSTSEGASSGIPVEVVLNWTENQQMQRQDGILQPAPLPGQASAMLKSDIGPHVGRMALFEVSVTINDSGAHVDFVHNKKSHHQEKIQLWLQTFEHLVLEAIGRLRYHEPELTLSDVPLLRTSYKALARLGSDRLAGASLPSVRDIETIYPITPAQQEILMAQSQNIDAFHVSSVYELTAPDGKAVEATRLCKAWESIVANKPALRSIFIDGVSREGLFDQVVLSKISPNMLFIESSKPEEAVSKLPVMKTALTEPRHRLSVCHTSFKTLVRVDVSQAICDLTSVHSLIAELCRVYSGQATTHNEALHRTYLYHTSSLDTAYSLQVWKTDLVHIKPCLFPRLTLDTTDQNATKTHSFALDVTREQLVSFCQQRDVEPTALLQLAWALVLRAFVGMDHVVFGYQFLGRDDELLHGIGKAVGSFANVLPCPVDLSPNQTVKTCLAAVHEAFVNARKHQNLTMAEIQHALRLKDRHLFNTCLFFQDADPLAAIDDDEDARPRHISPLLVTSSRRTDCDVSLTALVVDGRIHANLTAAFLSDTQAQSVVNSFEAAVKDIIMHPTRLMAEVDLFTERGLPHMVVQDSKKPQSVSACLHDVILKHAQTHPNSQAVCSWDGDMSYIQLATLVARLRTYLVNLGVGPGIVVPVVLEKNRWAPVMLLAVLQAGASFAALDSQDPVTAKSTIRYLQPHLVLAAESCWKDLGALGLNIVIVNNAFFALLPPLMTALTREAAPDHAACVFVTPKKTSNGASRSIFFTHASLCAAFAAQGPALKMNAETRTLQLSAFNVDVSLVELLGTMSHGGCVCVPSPAERLSDLEGVVSRMGVTWSYMTSVLARRTNPALVPTLKTLCFRTRKLDADTYGPWLENRNVLLAYGAADICPLSISVTEVTSHNDLSIISPPLTGRFWILNPQDSRKLMPAGAIGELAIDSPMVTPHRFALDLPLVAPGAVDSTGKPHKARYLKTGHRVRHLGDGNVQFISSVRDDVVVNGSTVDVADVEQKIRRVLGPGVDVVVDKITTKDSLRILAAFLQLGDSLFHGQEGFQNVSLRVKERTFIAKKLFETCLETGDFDLPDHSVPAVFVPLKDLPMSTSLKINRRKLLRMAAELTYAELIDMSSVPNPHEIQRVVLGQKPLPLTRPEEVMRAIWARVLDISPADIKGTSSFFSVGGNTFIAAELVISCRKVGLRVSLTDIFNDATLTEICQSSTTGHSSKKTHKATTSVTGFDYKFVKDVIAPKLDCQVQHVLDVTEASSEQVHNLELAMYKTRGDVACLVLQFNGRVSPAKLETACEALSRLHPVLRTGFVIHEHKAYQVHCASSKPMFQKSFCPASRLDSVVGELVKQDQSIEFQPGVPCTGFTYLDAGEQGTLIIRLSKAQVDDASAPLIVQHLIALYEESKGVPTPSSFFEYMRAAKTANSAEGLEYWTAQLDGAKMTEVVAHSAPCRPTSRVKSLQEAVKVGSLNDYAITPDTLVKAAWAIVLANLSAVDDVVFGEVIQGHNISLPDKMDLSSMVGPLTNTIPVRVRFPPLHSTPLDLMKYMQRQRRANCRFESVGIQDLAQNRCTKWPSWTRFSTVVQHRTISPIDGSATYNIGGTTFTYKSFDAAARHVPDILVCSAMEGSERVNIELKFPEDRVSEAFAQDCMRLLVAALETLTHRDTLTQPMLQSAEEIRRSDKKIPLPAQDTEPLKIPLDHLLLPEQRGHLETAITDAWHDVVKSTSQGFADDKLHQTPFFNRAHSLLTAHFLAENLNTKLPKLQIKGIDAIRFSAEDILENPTMLSQLELIARRLREGGALSLPLPQPKTAPLRPEPSTTSINSTWRPRTSTSPAPPSHWRNSIRLLRGEKSKASIRALSIKPSSWKKSKDPQEQTSTPAATEPPPPPPPPAPAVASPASAHPDIHELMDIESLSGLLPRRKLSNSSDLTIDTIMEESVFEMPVAEGDVSPLSPTGSYEHRSMWGALLEKARPLSPRGFRSASKLAA